MKNNGPHLITPHKDYAASYAQALRDGMEEHAVTAAEISRIETDFDGWWRDQNDLSIPMILRNGTEAPRVAHSQFWLIDGDRFIGRVSVRHELTPYLSIVGGHIGYAVRTDARRKGYGHLMMELVKPHARRLGLARVMMTCHDGNTASARIIEKADGVLEGKFPHPHDDSNIQRRYWLVI